ncbi:MAG: GNAT family N-acetyltransferase [Proteobacteria bacterium]|nr:GNAT family N-acetyltransferase [Pseudomonadota bacterium]
MPSVQRHSPDRNAEWDTFVDGAKNATFLFCRGYMDYHAQRFIDHSLVFEQNGMTVALLPAHEASGSLSSHGGLTYGGLIVGDDMTTTLMLSVFKALIGYAREAGFEALQYKTVPTIYHRRPAEEDRYALFRMGAKLVRRDVLSVVHPAAGASRQTRRRRAAAKAVKAGLSVAEDTDFSAFWPVLAALLNERHDTVPVHSLAEIELLHSRFPNHIRLFTARDGAGEILAGAVIYESIQVAHVQYMATSAAGRGNGALDLVLSHLLDHVYAAKQWFDFGISNEAEGRVLNEGLIEFKEGFGARAIVHDSYRFDLAGDGR